MGRARRRGLPRAADSPTVVYGHKQSIHIGVEKIVEVELTDDEKVLLDKSAAHVRDLVEAAQKL